jgi:hypothetical protein
MTAENNPKTPIENLIARCIESLQRGKQDGMTSLEANRDAGRALLDLKEILPRGRSGGKPTVGSSVHKPSAANDSLIDRTIALWRPRLGRELTREDARQVVENVTGFFSTLHKWFRANAPVAAQDNCEPSATSGPGEVHHER